MKVDEETGRRMVSPGKLAWEKKKLCFETNWK